MPDAAMLTDARLVAGLTRLRRRTLMPPPSADGAPVTGRPVADGDAPGAPALVRADRAGEMLDRLFAFAVIVSVAATVFVLLPGVHGHVVLPTVDLALDTITLVVCATLTALAWARFRENRVIAAAYHAAAFLALAVAYGIGVAVSLLHSDSIGSLADPVNGQVLVFAVAGFAAALLFMIAGAFTERRTYGWRPRFVLVAPALVVILTALVAAQVNPPPEPLQIIRFEDGSQLPHVTPFGAIVHLVTAGLFFVGAYASRRLWHAGHAVIDGWIAVGLVFAGFAEIHWSLYPSAHPGQVSTGDLLRLACSICLLLGLEHALRAGLRQLRTANVELAQLRDAEGERAVLEERTRLARELHDGLAQDLWLAKLRTGELASMDDLPAHAQRAARDAMVAIDIGLGDARDAVAALRSPAHADSGFCALVRRAAEDFGDRYGLRVEFTFEGEHADHVDPRTQAEILRITQEALTNVARHANATIAGVRLAIRGGRITLRIVDNGIGFDPLAAATDTFGLASMAERTAIIGGRIRVVSRVGAGTRVVVTAPTVRPALAGGANPG
jgi:signal transduction histidine kinase